MPSVVSPLMSMDATGTLNKTLVFSKGGGVRIWVKPKNVYDPIQGNQRQYVAAIQAVLKITGVVVREAMKLKAPIASRWNSYFLGTAIGPDSQSVAASINAFVALTATPMGLWDTAFAGLVFRNLDYKEIDDITVGCAGFIVCRALFLAGIETALLTPGAANASTWHAALIAAT